MDFLKRIGIFFTLTALSPGPAWSAPYAIDQSVAAFQAKDRFDKAFTFKPAETRHLLVSHDMESGDGFLK